MNLHLMLSQSNKSQKKLADELHIGEPMISKFKNYVCLPTPTDMKKICEALNCNVLDIYNKQEITFIEQKKRKSNEIGFYRLTVTLPYEYRQYFDKKLIRKLGYSDLQDLIEKLVIEKIKKKKAKLETRHSKMASEINLDYISHENFNKV